MTTVEVYRNSSNAFGSFVSRSLVMFDLEQSATDFAKNARRNGARGVVVKRAAGWNSSVVVYEDGSSSR